MKRTFVIIIALLLAVSLVSPALAQGDYYFAVEKEVVHVYWNADGTMSLDYTWVFVNQPGAHVIDFVDVGMPNYNFYTSTATADVNGVPVSVSESDYAGDGSGFAIVLGGQSIPAGQRATVHVYVGQVTKVLYPDTDDETYASAVFAPTYFGSQYVTGSTDLTVTFHLPPGVGTEEPRWHTAPSGFPSEPQTGFDGDGRIFYTWNSPNANMFSEYQFGASFPKTYVPAEAVVTAPAFDFFGLIASLSGNLFNILCCGIFAFMFIGMPIISAVQGQRRKLKYLPPKVSIEGHGIKRGLTAVEAAILMEQSLDKVMTMMLFSVIKKGAAEVLKRDPLELSVAKDHRRTASVRKRFPESLRRERRYCTPQVVAGDDSHSRPQCFGQIKGLQPQRDDGVLQGHHRKSLGAGGGGWHA
jgi:hypothetical protein